MARETTHVVKLHELTVGQPPADFYALLIEKARGSTRGGKPFFTCKFRDHRRTVSCAVWHDGPLFHDCDKAWTEGAIYKLRGTFTLHDKYGPTIEVLKIRETTAGDREEGLNEDDFFERSRFDSDEMLADIRGMAEKEIVDELLRQLVLALLDTHAETLKILPATAKHFFPFPGGWLEHVRNVTRTCLILADLYAERYPEVKPFNRDLIVAGAILHDLGRAAELLPGRPGEVPAVTIPGRLIGVLPLARDLIRTAAAAIPELNPELLLLLEHVVLSHLALPEWGSPRLPAIPEVLILHHADDLDAKFEMYARCLTRDLGDGPFTERDPVLRQPLLKGRMV